MKYIYHSDIYKFDTPASNYWEDIYSKNLNLEKLTKNINSEVVDVTGHLGGYNFQWAWSSGYVAGQYA